jgi:hypothetical protein
MDEEEVSIEDLVTGEEIHVVLRGRFERHERGQVRDLRTSQVNPNLRFVTVNGIPLAVNVQTPSPNRPRFYRRIPVAGQTLPPASQGNEGQPLVAGSLTATQMAEIPLDKLKVGDRVVATLTGGFRQPIVHGVAYTGTIAEIQRFPTDRRRGKTQVIVWLDRAGGIAHDLGLRLTVEDETPEWTFTEDPAFTEEKTAVLGLAHVARRKNLPEDVEGVVKGYLTRKRKGGRRRKTRKSRR